MRQLNAFTGKLSRVLLAIVLSFSLSPVGYAFAADEAPDAVQEGAAGEGSDSGAAQGDQPASDDPESGAEGEGQQVPEAPADPGGNADPGEGQDEGADAPQPGAEEPTTEPTDDPSSSDSSGGEGVDETTGDGEGAEDPEAGVDLEAQELEDPEKDEKDEEAEEEEEADDVELEEAAEKKAKMQPSISYRTHVQNVGWQEWKKDGKTSGTQGRALRLEGIKIKVGGKNVKGGIRYRTHVQNIGWQGWAADGELAGTSGRALRLEAIKIELTGEVAKQFDVYYRVHAQNFGWMGWAKNGESAGSEGYAYRLEAIEVVLVEKGKPAPGDSAGAFKSRTSPGTLNYRTHVQNYGWMDWKADGSSSGTTGRALRMEAIQLKLSGDVSGGVRYCAHVQNVGWQGWKADGATAGTSGRSLRVEAVKIELTGAAAKQYDVYYRVHAQTFGWMGWAKNGEPAGTAGYSCRLEALQVKLVAKGAAAPGDVGGAYHDANAAGTLDYCVLVRGSGWQGWKSQGATAGTTGKSLRLEGIRAKTQVEGLGVVYRAHVQDVGWEDWHAGDNVAGKKGKRMEAIQVKLTGDAADTYDVYYRVHVEGIGWMGWAKNGASAGTEGMSRRIEAVQMKLMVRGAPAPGSTAMPFCMSKDSLISSLSRAKGGSIRVFGGSYSLNSAAGKRLQAHVNKMSRTYNVCFVMIDLNTGMGISYNPNRSMYSASTIKGPYVAAVNKYSPGSVNTSWGNIMKQTITVSSNEGYAACRNHWGSSPMSRYMSNSGISGHFSSSEYYVFMTSNDLAKMWVSNYDYFFINTNKNSEWCRNLYTRSSNSFINSGLSSRYTVYTKPGWIASGGSYTVRNDAGIVMADGHPYVVAIMTNDYDDWGSLTKLARCIDDVHSDMV